MFLDMSRTGEPHRGLGRLFVRKRTRWPHLWARTPCPSCLMEPMPQGVDGENIVIILIVPLVSGTGEPHRELGRLFVQKRTRWPHLCTRTAWSGNGMLPHSWVPTRPTRWLNRRRSRWPRRPRTSPRPGVRVPGSIFNLIAEFYLVDSCRGLFHGREAVLKKAVFRKP